MIAYHLENQYEIRHQVVKNKLLKSHQEKEVNIDAAVDKLDHEGRHTLSLKLHLLDPVENLFKSVVIFSIAKWTVRIYIVCILFNTRRQSSCERLVNLIDESHGHVRLNDHWKTVLLGKCEYQGQNCCDRAHRLHKREKYIYYPTFAVIFLGGRSL